MKIVKESLNEGRDSIPSRGMPPSGFVQAGNDPAEDFKYSLYKDWLRIKEQKSKDEFVMSTNWGPDIIIKIVDYKK